MPSRHGDDKLLAAHASPEFTEAVDSLAKFSGVSRAKLIREALVRVALGIDPPTSKGGDPRE